MAVDTTFVRARVDTATKEEAATVLAELGLTVSDIIRMVLVRVAKDRAVPLDLKVPNAETQKAMREGRLLLKKNAAGFSNGDDLIEALDG